MTVEIQKTNVYKIASSKLREKWNAWYDDTINIDMYIQTMLNDLENQEYSRSDAINIIVEDHKDLKGFSRAHIYRSLPKESKRKYNTEYNMLPNNTDVSNETFGDLQQNTKNNENITTDNVNIPPKQENIVDAQIIPDNIKNKIETIYGKDSLLSSEDVLEVEDLKEQIKILNHKLDGFEQQRDARDEEIESLKRQLKIEQDTVSTYFTRNKELEKQINEQPGNDNEKNIIIEELSKKLADAIKSFRDEVSIFYRDQEIPLKCFASPLTKTITVDIDMDKVKKLYGGKK